MKGGAMDRTKVVLRHLPPSLSESALSQQIDAVFSGRYNWLSFRPAKFRSQKHVSYSRAYIQFKSPDDVLDFADFFNAHVFVNEKGSHFKLIVEYAPSQRVPIHRSKKDARDGTIFKDSEYLEFLDHLAKPVENLPSAEIQLEKREAERSGAAKDIPIVTPLMDFVRQKRAAKGPRRSISNGKVSRKAGTLSNGTSSSATSRRGSGKKRVPNTMYVARNPSKSSTIKDKSTYTLVPRQGDHHLSNKTSTVVSSDGAQTLDENAGASGSNDAGKKKILLLKGKGRETITISDFDSMSQHKSVTSSAKTAPNSTALKRNQRPEGSGRIIRRILSNKDLHQSQSSGPHSEQQIQASNLEKEKQQPRSLHVPTILKSSNGTPDNRIGVHDLHVSSERQERRVRHRDRPDRGIWTNRSNGGDDALSLSASSQAGTLEGGKAELKHDMPNAGGGELKSLGSGRASHSSENGFSKHFGRRGPPHGVKDVDDGNSLSSEGKPPRRISGSAYGSHEKQVWVQKASSGT
ncbi:hypothetical protein TanjilG_14922 [Lupinus angustifolius]|uniref:UPF3 domain-containing protein n=1 Tax=Lupinus angustifolius TaxID=3871 RepID=A0A1J7G6V8_LUPAN|nr:PREDICTED: regulator of nonsense transcripts UPF3-like isoform X1 [Lupinus angustifolius]OIV96245.1 hypothetical protein TanjilG_14922 [Lupinus angustifolius]